MLTNLLKGTTHLCCIAGHLFIQGFVPIYYTMAVLYIVLYYSSLIYRVLREYNIDEIRTGMSLVPGNRYENELKK